MNNPILCPIRNGVAYTKAALPTFLAQDCGDITVFFVDNESSDGTREFLNAQTTANIKVSHQTPPLSVAASWNFGLRWLFANGAEHVLVVNNDVELRPDMYRELLAANLPFATGVGVRSREQMNEPFTRKDRPHPDFSAFLIRQEAWDRVGPFDQTYVGGYAEDADWHVRAHRVGVELTCIGIPFLHHASGTIKCADRDEAERIGQAANANRKRFREKYGCEVGSPEYEALFTDGVGAQLRVSLALKEAEPAEQREAGAVGPEIAPAN